jgi:hypothetical protein
MTERQTMSTSPAGSTTHEIEIDFNVRMPTSATASFMVLAQRLARSEGVGASMRWSHLGWFRARGVLTLKSNIDDVRRIMRIYEVLKRAMVASNS